MSVKKHVPNFITFLNLACGFSSLIMLIEGKYVAAMWWMFLAVIFDAVDGKIASILNVKSDLGGAMDMLADVGLLPGVSLYLFFSSASNGSWVLTLAAWVAGIGYTFAGLLRETRFITSQKDRKRSEGFVGLAIAPPAGFNVAVTSLAALYPKTLYTPLVFLLVFLFAGFHAYLMVFSNIIYYRWGIKGISAQFISSLLIGVLAYIYFQSFGTGSAVFFIGICAIYIYSHLFMLLFKNN
jgi:phosphatidylserine synthase